MERKCLKWPSQVVPSLLQAHDILPTWVLKGSLYDLERGHFGATPAGMELGNLCLVHSLCLFSLFVQQWILEDNWVGDISFVTRCCLVTLGCGWLHFFGFLLEGGGVAPETDSLGSVYRSRQRKWCGRSWGYGCICSIQVGAKCNTAALKPRTVQRWMKWGNFNRSLFLPFSYTFLPCCFC